MMFQDEHDLTVDGIAGPKVWRALLADAIANKRRRTATATCTCTETCRSS